MSLKIKWNDDRIRGAATAVLLLSRDRLLRKETTGLVQNALDVFRHDLDAYKSAHPIRTLAAAKDVGAFKDAYHREAYEKLLAAVESLLGRLEKNHTQFNSLTELDNYLIFNLRTFG